jgi:molybdopterin synthase catalytic subunit
MAESELATIAAEAAERFGAGALVVEHRVGYLSLGEVSVAIAAAHAHRKPAMECSQFVIEQIKQRVPIWKLEHYADGTREWVDPTAPRNAARV